MTTGVGTDAFLAPVAKLESLSPVPFKSEFYSLGLILHFLLTKQLPNRDCIKSGVFEIPDIYTRDVVKIMASLLRE